MLSIKEIEKAFIKVHFSLDFLILQLYYIMNAPSEFRTNSYLKDLNPIVGIFFAQGRNSTLGYIITDQSILIYIVLI